MEEIRQHGFAQIENLREKQKTLSTLQVHLSPLLASPSPNIPNMNNLHFQANLLETEKKGEMVEKELRSKIRKILAKEAEIEQLEKEINVLNDRQTLVSKENADLRRRIGEEEEDARKVLAQFSTYRTKMEGHRVAVWLVASRGEAQKVLEEKKASVRKLKKKREELREDLDKPNGSTVEKAKVEAVVHAWVFKSSCYSELLLFKNLQREIDALEVEISAMKKTVAEKRARLLEETETHAQFKEDAEVRRT